MQKIYLAGPDVFLPNAVDVGRKKRELCTKYGFIGLFPMDNDREGTPSAEKIFRANCGLMEEADIGLFNLMPFRGPSADVGTIFELGFMCSMGKPVHGYTCDARLFADRVKDTHGAARDENARLCDRDGYAIEEFNLYDNLMIAESIRKSGIDITFSKNLDSLESIDAFEICLNKVKSKAKN